MLSFFDVVHNQLNNQDVHFFHELLFFFVSYMISTIFSSASLAAVTTVVMFLLTYMPYVVVIAMEASMSLSWRIFIVSMQNSESNIQLHTNLFGPLKSC